MKKLTIQELTALYKKEEKTPEEEALLKQEIEKIRCKTTKTKEESKLLDYVIFDYEPTEEDVDKLYDDEFNEWLENETFGIK